MIGYEGLNASTKSEHVAQTFIHRSIVKMKGRGSTAYEASMSYMSYIYIQHLWRQYRWWQGKTLYGTACADQSIPNGTQTYARRSVAGLFEGHPVCISTFHRSFYNNIEIGEYKYFDWQTIWPKYIALHLASPYMGLVWTFPVIQLLIEWRRTTYIFTASLYIDAHLGLISLDKRTGCSSWYDVTN